MSQEDTEDQSDRIELEWKNTNVSTESKPLSSYDITEVAQIDNGWLLKFRHFHGASSLMTVQAIAFIPDRKHQWNPQEVSIKWESVGGRKTPNFNEWTERIRVHNGWVYKNCLVTKGKSMSISLVYAPFPNA